MSYEDTIKNKQLTQIKDFDEIISSLDEFTQKSESNSFETYEDACKDAVKYMEGKTDNFNFKIFQIPRDEQGRFTWERIQ